MGEKERVREWVREVEVECAEGVGDAVDVECAWKRSMQRLWVIPSAAWDVQCREGGVGHGPGAVFGG